MRILLALLVAALSWLPAYGAGWAGISGTGSLPAFHYYSAETQTLSVRVCFAGSGILDAASPAPDRLLFELMPLAGRDIPREELDRVKDGGGIIIDGQSGLEYSYVHAAAVPGETERALGILSSLIYAPCQNEELFAEVRAQAADELLRQEGQAYYALDRGLNKTILANHPYGFFYSVTADALGEVPLARALAHHAKIMAACRIFIVSCGPQTTGEIAALIRAHFPARPMAAGFAKNEKKAFPPFPEAKNEQTLFPHRAANTPYLKAEFAMPGPGSASYPASLVLARVLSEMLMERVRSDKGLVYSVWASPPSRTRAASAELVLYRASDLAAAVSAMRGAIAELRSSDMADGRARANLEEAVIAAKNQIACSLAAQNITPRERCANFASWYIAGGGKNGTAGVLGAIAKVAPAEVVSLAQNSFDRMHWGIAYDPAAAEPPAIQWLPDAGR